MSAATSFDPQVQQIATVYARGFLQAATQELRDSDAIQSVVQELEELTTEVLLKQPQWLERLASRRSTGSDQNGLLQRTLGTRISSFVLRFLGVVSQHGRIMIIGAIAAKVRQLANQAAGIVPVEITSAVELSPEVEARVTEKLAVALGRKIELAKVVNPELLGGLQVRVGDTVFDGSVQGRLERVRRTAFERAAERIRAEFDRFVSVQ
jgi:F-type H+-transporting ATPase subunit delta